MKLQLKIIFTVILALTSEIVAIESPTAFAERATRPAHSAQQVQGDLARVYRVSARIRDLLGLLKTANSKMTDTKEGSSHQKVVAVDQELQTLESLCYQFYYHPQDAESGEKTLETVQDLVPAVREIGSAAEHYPNANTGLQLQQAAADLSKLRDQIRAYVQGVFPGRFLPAPAPAPVATGPVRAESSPSPPSPAHPNQPTPTASQSTTAQLTTASVPVHAVHLEPQQVQKLLLNVYFATARIKDLLSVIQPQSWKMAGAEQTAFEQQLESVQTALGNLERCRYQFASHLQDASSAERTAEAISNLLPQLQQIEAIVSQFEGRQAGAQFEQPQRDLASLGASMTSYVASLRAAYQKQLAVVPPGSPSLQTERISGAAAPPPPIQYIPGLTPPLTGSQVKAVLYAIYVSTYRIRDLLTQEHPGQWKASLPDRTAAMQARARILSGASELEKWRGLFSEDPDNMYDAFQLYRSVQELVQPVQAFSLAVDRYENTALASDYSRRAGDLEARLSDLIPYINFFLKHESHSIDLYQSDLASCQNRLSYAMHGFMRPAVPMKNIVPDFQGRRMTRRKTKATAHTKSHPAERKEGNSR
jgi:hypothetical protein